MGTFYQPARTIGGDFGLIAPRQDGLTLLVCDVSGHGISSALVANRIYTEAISQMESGVGLTAMMQQLNQFVMRRLAGSVFFFTLMAARLHRDLLTIELAGAGHPPTKLVSRDEKPRLLESRRAILGLLDDAVDGETTLKVPVQPGDRLVIYTDGFTESFNSQQEMLGVEGLKRIVCDTAGLPLPMMKQQIIDRVTAWRSGEMHSVLTHAEISSWRKWFHAAVQSGGGRAQLDFGSGESLDDFHGAATLGAMRLRLAGEGERLSSNLGGQVRLQRSTGRLCRERPRGRKPRL